MNNSITSILLLLFYIIVLLLLSFFAIGGISLAPWVPIYPSDRKRVMAILRLQAGDVLYELGSGTGIVTLQAAAVPGVRAIGLEISPVLFVIAWLKKIGLRRTQARFWLKNLYKTDLQDATVIYVYGMPKQNQKVVAKLLADCKSGTRVLSYTFTMSGLPLIKKHKTIETEVPVYEYQIP